MNAADQARRRALKAERRALDRAAQEIAAAARAVAHAHVPSTRSKQSAWNHQRAAAINDARSNYQTLRARMALITAELREIERAELSERTARLHGGIAFSPEGQCPF